MLAACSSTIHYEASGYYDVSSANESDVSGYISGAECGSKPGAVCKKIALRWEAERYCGIYSKAQSHTSDRGLRVGTSPSTIEGWVLENGVVVFRGDDEDFELASGHESAKPGEDLLCGAFKPGIDLLEVRDGDGLILQIFCRPKNRSILLMPPSESGYPLKVSATKDEKAWLGCGK
jgi:hypothetical protein